MMEYSTYKVLKFEGYETGTTTPTYTYVNKSGKDTWGIDDAGFVVEYLRSGAPNYWRIPNEISHDHAARRWNVYGAGGGDG